MTEGSSTLPPTPRPTDQGNDDEAQISVIRIGPMWRNKVSIWFLQVEAQFFNAKCFAETRRYNHLLAGLESDVADRISDFFSRPLSETPYTDLKARIINEFEESEGRKVTKLLSELELGDRKPSGLLREMRSLSGTNIAEDFLKSMFLQRLPQHVRSILATSKDDLDGIAGMADKIMEYSSNTSSPVYAVADNPPRPTPSIDERIDRLENMIAELSTSIHRNRSRSRSTHSEGRNYRSRSRSRNNSNRNKETHKFCWYHRTFWKDARHCEQPCKYDPGFKKTGSMGADRKEN